MREIPIWFCWSFKRIFVFSGYCPYTLPSLTIVPVLSSFWRRVFLPWDLGQPYLGGCPERIGFVPGCSVRPAIVVITPTIYLLESKNYRITWSFKLLPFSSTSWSYRRRKSQWLAPRLSHLRLCCARRKVPGEVSRRRRNLVGSEIRNCPSEHRHPELMCLYLRPIKAYIENMGENTILQLLFSLTR